MTLPKLVKYKTIGEYHKHFRREYCNPSKTITTLDGITVDFFPNQFKHAFYESSGKGKRDKGKFSLVRARRIDWIKYALKNPNASLYVGYDKKKKIYDRRRRVCLKNKNYIVIIQFRDHKRAIFVTHFPADTQYTFASIRKSPAW